MVAHARFESALPLWGVYVSGDAIFPRRLVAEGHLPLVFHHRSEAQAAADRVEPGHPELHVYVRMFRAGDEARCFQSPLPLEPNPPPPPPTLTH